MQLSGKVFHLFQCYKFSFEPSHITFILSFSSKPRDIERYPAVLLYLSAVCIGFPTPIGRLIEIEEVISLLAQRNDHIPRPLEVPRLRTCTGRCKQISRFPILEENKRTFKVCLTGRLSITPFNCTRIRLHRFR